jgi:formate/nitrite transporter FocA (FNT family)
VDKILCELVFVCMGYSHSLLNLIYILLN